MSVFDLKLGFKCNNNCIHCVVADKRDSRGLTFPEMLEVIRPLPAGTFLQITGGEPTLFKEKLLVLLKQASKQGLLPAIQTNGTGFVDSEFLELCAPYLYNVHIAIHSSQAQVHDRIVGVSGMWEQTIQGFKNLLKYRESIEITTQTVLSKVNINTLYETFQFIQNQAPGVHMSMTYPHLNGNAWKFRDQVAFRYSDYSEIFYKTLQDFEPYIFTESIPPCFLYPFLNHDSLEKTLLDQTESRIGIDISQGPELHDYNYSDLTERRKGPRCQKCCFNNQCIGVWKEYIEVFKDKLDLYPLTTERQEYLNERYHCT